MKPMDFEGRNVLITGGSAGIGKELAVCFAQAKANLVLVARGEDRLRETASRIEENHGVKAHIIAEDLSKEDAPRRIFEKTKEEVGELFALVNNAGFGRYGSYVKSKMETDLDLIRVNVIAPQMLTKLFLPQMTERGDGGVLFTSSIAALFPGPKMAVYHAAKAFIQSFAEALFLEMRPLGVGVTILSPGFVNTELLAGTKAITESAMRFFIMQPEKVAKAGFNAFKKRKLCVVPGIQYKAMGSAAQILSRRARGRLAKKMMAPNLK